MIRGEHILLRIEEIPRLLAARSCRRKTGIPSGGLRARPASLRVALCSMGIALMSGSVMTHADKAGAQTVDYDRGHNQSVLDETAASYGPDGLPLGAFRLYPALTLQEFYDSNIYATQLSPQSDAIGLIQPQVRLASNWGRDQLALYGQDSLVRYADHTTEDSNAWTLGGKGELDVRGDWSVQARVEHQKAIEPRTDPSTPIGAAKPTVYDLQIEALQVIKTWDRVRFTGSAEDDDYTYGRVPLNGGAVINEQYRDNSHYIYGAVLEYALSPEFSLHADSSYNFFDYVHFFPNEELSYVVKPGGATALTLVALPTNLNQNSDGYTADLGADFDITHLIRGTVAAGYLSQNAHDPRLPDYAGPHAQAQIDYFLTPIITLHLSTTRTVGASGLIGAPAFLSTDVKGAVEYAFRRNIVFAASADGGWDEYKGIDRDDVRQNYLVTATYYLGRHLSLVGRYNHASLDSRGSGAGQTYAVDQAGFSIVYAR